MDQLSYNISTGILEGLICGRRLHLFCGAGGRAGSTTSGAESWYLSGNVFATAIGGPRQEGTHIFGPLPLGEYELRLRAGKRRWIDLKPLRGNMFGRSRFAIHERGPIGSHGCIVVYDKTGLERLHDLVEEAYSKGRAPCRLRVVAIGQDLDRMLRTA